MMWHGKNFRGIINKAKQMIFDNTGTNLISTNAEDAIKEVNSNLTSDTNCINISATTTTTYNQVISAILAVIDFNKLTRNSTIIIGSTIFSISGNTGSIVIFTNPYCSATDGSITTLRVDENNPMARRCKLSSSITIENLNNTAIGTDTVKLFYY